MKIGIDARLYFQTGVGTYLRNYLLNLERIAPPEHQYVIYVMKQDRDKIRFHAPQFLIRTTTARWHGVNEQLAFLIQLLRERLDVMHFTYFSYPVFYLRPFVATVHDLTPLLLKTGKASTSPSIIYQLKHLVLRFVLWMQIRNARAIITPSRAVKDQIAEKYGMSLGSKVVPISEGVDDALIHAKPNESLRNHISGKYFLYVGNFYPHKNVPVLIAAFEGLLRDLDVKDVHLVMVGPENYFSKRIRDMIPESLRRNVCWHHSGAPGDLAYLYSHALALINPSLSEGFGLPLIEATYFGCPVIASDTPVFREIMKENYVPFDPLDSNSLVTAMRQTLLSLRNTSVPKKNVPSTYSFERMTKETIVILLKEILHRETNY